MIRRRTKQGRRVKSTCVWEGAISGAVVRERTFTEKVTLEQRPEEWQLLEGRDLCLFCLKLGSQSLGQALAHSRHSARICGMRERR